MTLDEIKAIVAEIQYKEGWTFHIGGDENHSYLQIKFLAKDNFSDKMEMQHCRKWQLSKHMTKTEIVRTAFLAVLQAERHETEELFTFKKQAIFNSHISIDNLVNMCSTTDGLHEFRAP